MIFELHMHGISDLTMTFIISYSNFIMHMFQGNHQLMHIITYDI